MIRERVSGLVQTARDRPAVIGVLAVLVGGGVVLWSPLPAEMSRMLGITLFCVVLWIGAPAPPWFTALIGVGLLGAFFSTDLALYGFKVPATWLILFGILIGEAIAVSGLADTMENWFLNLVPHRMQDDALATFRFLLVVLSFAALALAFVVPSALVRVLVLAPILVTVGDLFESRQAKIGIFLGPLFATYYGGSGILTASLANIVIAGILESTTGQTITWTQWLLSLFPVMGFGRTVSIIAVAYYLYRPRDNGAVTFPDTVSTSFSAREKHMLVFLALGVIVWATDFIHGLHPLYGALLVVLLAFLPSIGVAEVDVVGDVDFSMIFFVGAIFAIAEGLSRTGFTTLAAEALFDFFPAESSMVLVSAAVVAVSSLLALLIEGLAAASVLTPIIISFVQETGAPLVPVLMIEAVAFNTYYFPYQSAVLVGILAQDVVGPRELIRMTVAVSLVTIVVLIPLQITLFILF